MKKEEDDVHKLVLVRHGESEWNKQNRFTGWCDVSLSEKGEEEARNAGRLLKQQQHQFDIAYTSLLTRAICTLHNILQQLDLLWIPVRKHWELNERHYGGLQGYNKAEKSAEVGEEQVHIWRRSYDIPPPPLALDDKMHPRNDPRYRDLLPQQLPVTESLRDTVERVIPFWKTNIEPNILDGKRVIIAAHGNSLRALVKHIKGISDADIVNLNIPTAQPLLIELDNNGAYLTDYYLKN